MAAAQETIDHATLLRLAAAEAVLGVRAVGEPGGWALVVRYGAAERPLAAQRSRQLRLFRRLESLVAYLRSVGIARFEVDAANFAAEVAPERRRPDRAEALRRAHEAAARLPGLGEEAAAAIREAGEPDAVWLPHKEAKREWVALRAALLARASMVARP